MIGLPPSRFGRTQERSAERFVTLPMRGGSGADDTAEKVLLQQLPVVFDKFDNINNIALEV